MNQTSIATLMLAKLTADYEALRQQWAMPTGTNTRHFVIDDVLPKEIAEAAYSSFPNKDKVFALQNSFRERKRVLQDPNYYNELLSAVNGAMQDARLISLISEITRIKNLEPDLSLARGGLSTMIKGDFLNPHIDNSHDGKRERYRRLNILYYVSPDWQLENGGNFELWDEARKTPKTIVSLQNRLVVMETTSHSWHSVSPVTSDGVRCCISNYYYSKEAPDISDYYHVTSFKGRPDQPIRTIIGSLDNAARNAISRVTGKSRPLKVPKR